jgi:hypothetical protein
MVKDMPKKTLILQAINMLPDKKGTKTEIIKKIQEIYGFDIDEETIKGIQTTLTKKFEKEKANFILNEESESIVIKDNPEDCRNMKEKIIYCMNLMPGKIGMVPDIKETFR